MKAISARERIIYLNMLQKYMLQYGWAYDAELIEYIQSNLCKPSVSNDVLAQIRTLLGMISEPENIYLGFAKMIGDRYGWDTNILEVGGGYYPMFAKYVDDLQSKHGRGTITVMDPNLVIGKLGRVKLRRECFSAEMKVSDFDLIVGICPCDATKDIIQSAIINKKEFFITICGCSSIPGFEAPWLPLPFQGRDRMFMNIEKFAKRQERDGFDVSFSIDNKFSAPIISSKRKK